MTKISVIVPIYNVEQYIHRCIDSILNQTFTDFELILVNDGSTDNCGKICDEYAQKDDRIFVIHKPNGGVSQARNCGIAASTGKYISFVDADDYVKEDYLQVLYDNMLQNNADCVSMGYLRIDNFNTITPGFNPNKKVLTFDGFEDKYNYIAEDILLDKTRWELWTRLFKASIIEKYDIRLCETCENYAEDLAFLLTYLMHCSKISYIDYAGYFYSIRDNSMMETNKNRIRLNPMNEAAHYFYDHLKTMPDACLFIKQFPVIHFLFAYNQIKKLYFSGNIEGLISESKRISNKKWYNAMALKSVFHKKAIIGILGETKARWCLCVYYYTVHKSSKLFIIQEKALNYFTNRKGENNA